MEEYEMTYGIDRLAELLAERGIEFCVGDRTSLVFMDGVGNLHECWMAGAEENLVNVCITITPEQALSVRDLNGIVSENAKLRESVRNLLTCVKHEECEESCPNYEPMYTDYGYEKNGSTVVESEYLGCCTVGLENCNSMLFDTDEYLRELGIEVES